MDILIAIGHIAGAVIVSIILGLIILFISSWELERNKKRATGELALKLGIPVADLEDEEKIEQLAPKIIEISMEKFSDELFKNRISDFLGIIRTAWNCLSNILQVILIIAVCWYTFTDDLGNAVYAWLINAIVIFFFVVGVVFALICKILTWRYPGQAKEARKSLVNYHNETSA
ncbi:uncharacterized protein sS8_1329 [Methylocaldum marinum]|uniref:Uncharacterized protein n=1 Tax=Methylocaldum marinum TaxID=1432792 RepID=A0A250KU28_9GAMM|nr:hypothetical protein [Methylocaldum marinum]BBA33289.1 uncharacterized protein sS8_1329 [Methylocaldum marinum]